MVRDSVEDPTESKFSPAHFCENKNFSDLAGELAKHKDNHFNNGFTLKNEDHSECNDDSLTNNVESKTETLKHEDDIDIIYEDVKPETCEEKSNEKSENGSYTNVSHELSKDFWENGNFIEIGPNSSHELSKDSGTWPQQNIEENGTAVEKDNDTRNHHERTHTDFLENRSFNDIAGELAEHKKLDQTFLMDFQKTPKHGLNKK
ncbi:hypothetical protein JTB14_018690 [Gonioctena quinquepunctata]|nr:hypothetical protein JTB14_018690 [Gonioctena quinquepunctata]